MCAHCLVLHVCCWLSCVSLLAQSWVCTANCGCGWSVGVVGVVGMVLLPIFPCIPSKFPPSAAIAPTCPALIELLYLPAPIISAHPPTTHASTQMRTCVRTTHTTCTTARIAALHPLHMSLNGKICCKQCTWALGTKKYSKLLQTNTAWDLLSCKIMKVAIVCSEIPVLKPLFCPVG